MKGRHLGLIIVAILLAAILTTAAYAEEVDQSSLPKAVKATLKAKFPKASIEAAQADEEGLMVYEIEIGQGERKAEITIAPDGTLIEVTREMVAKKLPEAVAKALKKAARGAEIKKVEKEIIHAVVVVVKLPVPQTVYEAEFVDDGKLVEVKVSPGGKILERQIVTDDDNGDDEADDDDGDDGDEDEDEGEQVSIKDVPKAVKATILKCAKGGEIEEIEREEEDGKVVYDVEISVGDKEYELEIAKNGKLLSKEADEADDDNDEGDDEADDDDDDDDNDEGDDEADDDDDDDDDEGDDEADDDDDDDEGDDEADDDDD